MRVSSVFVPLVMDGQESACLRRQTAVRRRDRLIAIGKRGRHGYVELIFAGRDQAGEGDGAVIKKLARPHALGAEHGPPW
jgi:hypothetical protein